MTLLNGWSERKNRSDERTRTIEGSSVFHSDDKVKDWCACSPTAARLDGEISDEKGILAMLRAQIARRTPLLDDGRAIRACRRRGFASVHCARQCATFARAGIPTRARTTADRNVRNRARRGAPISRIHARTSRFALIAVVATFHAKGDPRAASQSRRRARATFHRASTAASSRLQDRPTFASRVTLALANARLPAGIRHPAPRASGPRQLSIV
jgi:hypothetical protein